MAMNMSFFDHVKVLIDVVASSPFFLLILFVIIVLALLFITMKKKNQMETKQVFLLIWVIGLLVLLLQYGSSIGSLFDYFMNHVFVLIYFPNLAVYFLALVVSNVVMWKGLFGKKIDFVLKVVNSIAYFVIHYLFILLLSLITDYQLDIFSQSSIYQNSEVFSLIELSSAVFVVWMFFLLGYHCITKYLNKKKKIDNKKISDGSNCSKKRESLPNQPITTTQVKSNDEIFTLEEYRLLSFLLKEQQKKSQDVDQKELAQLQALFKRLK